MSDDMDDDEGGPVPESEYGVHAAHCCQVHGCKYSSDKNCPVQAGKIERSRDAGWCQEPGIVDDPEVCRREDERKPGRQWRAPEPPRAASPDAKTKARIAALHLLQQDSDDVDELRRALRASLAREEGSWEDGVLDAAAWLVQQPCVPGCLKQEDDDGNPGLTSHMPNCPREYAFELRNGGPQRQREGRPKHEFVPPAGPRQERSAEIAKRVHSVFFDCPFEQNRNNVLRRDQLVALRERNNIERPSFFGFVIDDLLTTCAVLMSERDETRAALARTEQTRSFLDGVHVEAALLHGGSGYADPRAMVKEAEERGALWGLNHCFTHGKLRIDTDRPELAKKICASARPAERERE